MTNFLLLGLNDADSVCQIDSVLLANTVTSQPTSFVDCQSNCFSSATCGMVYQLSTVAGGLCIQTQKCLPIKCVNCASRIMSANSKLGVSNHYDLCLIIQSESKTIHKHKKRPRWLQSASSVTLCNSATNNIPSNDFSTGPYVIEPRTGWVASASSFFSDHNGDTTAYIPERVLDNTLGVHSRVYHTDPNAGNWLQVPNILSTH